MYYINREFQVFLILIIIHSVKYARFRFTFAHELAHYFINEHRNTLS
jgi:Zn-dependent peptidase ImmA (M78 family)